MDRETPVVMYLNGPIDDTAVLDFRRARRAHPEGTIVVLNSPGGFLDTALILADEVFQAGLTTIIPSWAGCYSACAFVFLAGVERLALGELGVHQFTSGDPDAQRILADVLELLNQFGTPQELISLMLRTPHDDMHIFAADEIQALAISRGAPTGMDGIEEMGAFLQTFAPPILARASAALVVDPDGQRQDVQGEVIWGVTDEDGVFAVVGQIELGGGDITGTIVILGPTEADGEGRLFLGFRADDDLLRGSDRRTIETVFMTRSGSQCSGQTSFVQAGYDDEEGQFILVSSLRWKAFDLALLQQSRSIEILLTGGDQVDALVVIGINDEVAIVLSEALSAWGSVSAGFPIGDSPTLEVPRTAYLYDGGTRTEALATWYTAGCELAFRFDLPERDILIDVGFAQSRIYVSLEPADAFSNGVDAVTLISVGEDFDWIEGGSGFFFADLRSVDPLAMIAFLDWTSAIELLLKYADGTWARIVVTKGPSFGQLLDAAAATWTAAVAVDAVRCPETPWLSFAAAEPEVAGIAEPEPVVLGGPENTLYLELACGRVVVEMRPDLAPLHVERIKALTRSGFYDGMIFHRVIEGFMAQSGDPTGTGFGASQLPDIPAEFTDEPFVRGAVGMGRGEAVDSANSQFFIMFAEGRFLDGLYTLWGHVTVGMDCVDQVARGEPPANPDIILTMRVAADVQ